MCTVTVRNLYCKPGNKQCGVQLWNQYVGQLHAVLS